MGIFLLVVIVIVYCRGNCGIVQVMGVQFGMDMDWVIICIGVYLYQVFGKMGVVLLVCFGQFGDSGLCGFVFDVMGGQFVGEFFV